MDKQSINYGCVNANVCHTFKNFTKVKSSSRK